MEIKPLIMAHKGIYNKEQENSIEAVKKSLNHGAEIIELDIRKSSDGTLFCYHGNSFQYLFPRLSFKKEICKLKNKFPCLSTLEDIAKLVGNKSILFLDIKDYSIDLKEIKKALKVTKLKEVWIAARSLNYLRKLGKLPKMWKKVCNSGVWFLKARIKEVFNSGLYGIELMPWDFTKNNINELKNNGIEVAVISWFYPKNYYFRKCFKEQALWVHSYDLGKLLIMKKKLEMKEVKIRHLNH